MSIEEKLKKYLTTRKTILVRGIDAFNGMKYLKQYTPDNTTFYGDTENMRKILDTLEYSTGVAGSSIYVAAGDCFGVESEYKAVWFFKDSAPRDDREMQRRFEMILDFKEGKVLGVRTPSQNMEGVK